MWSKANQSFPVLASVSRSVSHPEPLVWRKSIFCSLSLTKSDIVNNVKFNNPFEEAAEWIYSCRVAPQRAAMPLVLWPCTSKHNGGKSESWRPSNQNMPQLPPIIRTENPPRVAILNSSHSNSQIQSSVGKLPNGQQAPSSHELRLHNFLFHILLVQTYLIKGTLWWIFKNESLWIKWCTFARLQCNSTGGGLQCKGHLRVWRLVITVPLVSGPLVAYRATE